MSLFSYGSSLLRAPLNAGMRAPVKYQSHNRPTTTFYLFANTYLPLDTACKAHWKVSEYASISDRNDAKPLNVCKINDVRFSSPGRRGQRGTSVAKTASGATSSLIVSTT